jgi:hypothetical protein
LFERTDDGTVKGKEKEQSQRNGEQCSKEVKEREFEASGLTRRGRL